MEDQNCYSDCTFQSFAFQNNNNVVALCEEEMIKIFEYSYDIYQQKTFVELKKTIKLNWIIKADSMKIYYDEILIIKAEGGIFYWINIKK